MTDPRNILPHAPLAQTVQVAVLAHQEERRIALCLDSLLAEPGAFPIHVVVNGSHDRTADIARGYGGRVLVHDFAQGGKSRSWNRFVFDSGVDHADICVFVDGDAEVVPGSIAALAHALTQHPEAQAAAGMPTNGRKVADYRAQMRRDHGLFGDLYALRGDFLRQMAALSVRLPDDLIGDDGLIGAFAKTALRDETHWDNRGVVPCEAAGFVCEPVAMTDPATWRMQYKRMINYSVRHFQNKIISDIMRGKGPTALPRLLSELYPAYLPRFAPRRRPDAWWFDVRALAKMRKA